MNQAIRFLKKLDPSVNLDGLTPAEIGQEAAAAALWLAEQYAETSRARTDSSVLLSDRQIEQYAYQLAIVERMGSWKQGFGADDAHYLRPELNPLVGIGVRCKDCVHVRGDRCQIVAGAIEPDGVCRLVLVPQGRVVQDSNDPVKTVLKWQGLELGLTHEPGDERHGKPMTASYGHVRGTYGQAEDGMAIDVYVGPDYLESRKVFRIEQLKPDTGELDEYKYVIGVASAAAARTLYLAHMPKRFFGKVRAVPIDEIRPRKQDSGRVIKWKGLSIGITHSPGDRRFPLGLPMRAFYGRIYGTWGQARDGKAIDAYVAHSFDPSADYPVFRVMQRDPATGLPDELKYGFGYSTAEAFARDYIEHAGRDRFGYVEPVSDIELDQYRADDRYHADSCGCEACQRKGRRKRKRRSPAAEELADEEADRDDDRRDAQDESIDLGDYVSLWGSEPLDRAIEQWVNGTKDWIRSRGLESAHKILTDSPGEAYRSLSPDRFEDALFKSLMLAELGGRVEVQEEGDRFDSLSDWSRLDAARPEWLRLPFDRAIEVLRSRLVIPLADYRATEEGYHDWAFSIAGLTRAELLQDAKFLLDQAIAEGNDFETFERQWGRLIGRKGWRAGSRRLYTIYDTNIRGAHGTGRGKQMVEPGVRSGRPFILWRWRDSPDPRLNHQALHNKAIATDHPFWQRCRFPCGFGCRCAGFAVSEQYCRDRGIEILTNPPDPEAIAEEGFRYPLQGLDEATRRQQQDRLLERLDPALKKAIEEERSAR